MVAAFGVPLDEMVDEDEEVELDCDDVLTTPVLAVPNEVFIVDDELLDAALLIVALLTAELLADTETEDDDLLKPAGN